MADIDMEKDGCEANVVHYNAVEQALAGMPDEDTLVDVAELFKVFGDSTRTKILSALFETELCVCDLSKVLGMSISAVSHQLRILRQTKIVKSRRSGKEIYYSMDDEHIARIYKMALEHLAEEN